MQEKKIPQRMCIACRQMKDKKTLLRIVKQQNGEIFLDKLGKAEGRGAYICKSESCILKCKKTKLLHKSWKMEVPLKIYEQLEEVAVAKT